MPSSARRASMLSVIGAAKHRAPRARQCAGRGAARPPPARRSPSRPGPAPGRRARRPGGRPGSAPHNRRAGSAIIAAIRGSVWMRARLPIHQALPLRCALDRLDQRPAGALHLVGADRMVAQVGGDRLGVAQEAGERFGPRLDPAAEHAVAGIGFGRRCATPAGCRSCPAPRGSSGSGAAGRPTRAG